MRTILCVALTALAAIACSSSTSNPNSTVEGKVIASTFALGAPPAVDAIDETGARTHALVSGDGAFRFVIRKGHVYRLVALTPKGEEPLVFPRTGGRLDKTFKLSSGAAVIALGNVRHFDQAPAGGFAVQSTMPVAATTTAKSTGGGGEPGECVDGAIMGSGVPCVVDNEKTSCEGGAQGADDQADGECVNGKDAKTGAACTDGDSEGEPADPAQAMAVPDRNPPNDVGGCDDGSDDGEESDD